MEQHVTTVEPPYLLEDAIEGALALVLLGRANHAAVEDLDGRVAVDVELAASARVLGAVNRGKRVVLTQVLRDFDVRLVVPVHE